MNRRNFFRTMVGGVAAAAAVRTFPFRVFSFPTEIVAPRVLTIADINAVALEGLRDDVLCDNFFVDAPWIRRLRAATIFDEFLAGKELRPCLTMPKS